MSAFESCEFVNLRVFFFGANNSQIRKITIANRLAKFGKTRKLYAWYKTSRRLLPRGSGPSLSPDDRKTLPSVSIFRHRNHRNRCYRVAELVALPLLTSAKPQIWVAHLGHKTSDFCDLRICGSLVPKNGWMIRKFTIHNSQTRKSGTPYCSAASLKKGPGK